MMNPAAFKEKADRLASFMEAEFNSCSDMHEQHKLIEEAINLGISAYTFRARHLSTEHKEQCIESLLLFVTNVLNSYANRLFQHGQNTEGMH